MVIFLLLLAVGVLYMIDAGLVWMICNLMQVIGLTQIGNWDVKFSWALTLIVLLCQFLFTPIKISNKNQ